jgi:serine/threonine protein kinase
METAKTLPYGPIRVSDERPPRRDAERSPPRRDELLLGRYSLLERLGAGGFGTVWRARDEQLGRAVALKRIALPSPRDRDRALREAHATARLSHPAIVSLYEACSDDDSFYLISELIEGDTLALLIEQDALCDEEIVEVGLALTDALAHAHSRGVVHRDVKPQNVLIPAAVAERDAQRGAGASAAAVAKLADFGGALLAGGEALTRTGDVFGTLAYMAPEQSDGRAAGPPADLYSLALVLYEALSGVNPVRGRTPAATARRIGEPIPPLARRRRDLPRLLTLAIDAALRADPARRGALSDLHDALAWTLERGLRRRLFLRRGAGEYPYAESRTIAEGTNPADRETPRAQGRPAAQAPWAPRGERPDPPAPQAGPPARARPTEPPVAGLQEPARTRRWALPRGVWVGCVLAVAVWQAVAGRAGVALLVLAAATPSLLLARRSGPGWLAAAAAPALGAIGLAAAFPALAGQRASWRARAGLAALGFWWLALAEPLLGRRLWLGPPSGMPARATWEASLASAAHVLGTILTPEFAVGTLVWAAAAMLLPWLVRGRSAALDVVLAIAWTVALLGAAALIERAALAHSTQSSPRGALLGAMLGCSLAICARALRGPVAAIAP